MALFARKLPVIANVVNKRVAVNFLDGSTFIGRLADYDTDTFVFEQCETVPAPGATPQPIQGRQYVDRINVWLQELP
jgi:small nuclear ribonucleoprotein (snRNP)-like protein